MTLSDGAYRALKRAHTLSGIVPVGAFLVAHFATNLVAVRGPAAFNRAAEALDRLPLLGWIELGFIAAPIAVHVVLGAVLGNARQAGGGCGYPRRWLRTVQRATGGALVAFVLFHVWSTRLSPEVARGEPDLFGHMSRHLADPGVLAFYGLGVLAAAAHFAIGLFEVAHRFGPGRAAPRAVTRLALAAFAALSLAGLNALFAFVDDRARWLEPRPPSARVESATAAERAP